MDNIESLLYTETGCEWEEVSRLYVDYKRQTSLTGQFCAFVPSSDLKGTLRPGYYIPKERLNLNNPGRFLGDYLNVKKVFIQQMPVVQLVLDSLPKIHFVTRIPPWVYIGELGLKGTICMRKIGSLNNSILSMSSFNTIAYEAKAKFGDLMLTTTENFDAITKKFSLESSVAGSLGETTFSIPTPNEFKVEMIPHKQSFIYQCWEYAGELGCEASGKYYLLDNLPDDVNQQVQITNQSMLHKLSMDDKWTIANGGAGKLSAQGKLLTGGAAIAWGACVFFTDGLCALPIAAGSLGAFSIFNLGRVAVAAY